MLGGSLDDATVQVTWCWCCAGCHLHLHFPQWGSTDNSCSILFYSVGLPILGSACADLVSAVMGMVWLTIQLVQALYDHTAVVDEELNFRAGNVITVTNMTSGGGGVVSWWMRCWWSSRPGDTCSQATLCQCHTDSCLHHS